MKNIEMGPKIKMQNQIEESTPGTSEASPEAPKEEIGTERGTERETETETETEEGDIEGEKIDEEEDVRLEEQMDVGEDEEGVGETKIEEEIETKEAKELEEARESIEEIDDIGDSEFASSEETFVPKNEREEKIKEIQEELERQADMKKDEIKEEKGEPKTEGEIETEELIERRGKEYTEVLKDDGVVEEEEKTEGETEGEIERGEGEEGEEEIDELLGKIEQETDLKKKFEEKGIDIRDLSSKILEASEDMTGDLGKDKEKILELLIEQEIGIEIDASNFDEKMKEFAENTGFSYNKEKLQEMAGKAGEQGKKFGGLALFLFLFSAWKMLKLETDMIFKVADAAGVKTPSSKNKARKNKAR